MEKDKCEFQQFCDLNVGDVFKFSPIESNEIPSRFFAAFEKDTKATRVRAIYGPDYTMELANNVSREVMVFPARRKFHGNSEKYLLQIAPRENQESL